MDTRRIAELLEPFLAAPLQQAQLQQISTYIDLLVRWNARINLTAIRTPEQIVTRHFGESLFAARHLLSSQPAGAPSFVSFEGWETSAGPPYSTTSPRFAISDTRDLAPPNPSAPTVIDVGSGPGFPGIPLKIFDPTIRVTLLESTQKKVAFLREVIRALTLTDIDVSPSRAQAFPPASAGLVTLRAVERFETILATAARLVVPDGRLALLIASQQIPPAHRLTPSFQWATPIPTPQSRDRVLLIGHKAPN
jgi:16S rRNA (guanine527-N7)-methyltransferase